MGSREQFPGQPSVPLNVGSAQNDARRMSYSAALGNTSKPKVAGAPSMSACGIGFNEVDWMPACWDRPPQQIGWHAGVVRAFASIEKELGVGKSQLVRRGFGICPRDSEVAVGVAGIGRRHPDAGDAFDVGDRCVADPMGADAKLGGPCQVLDAPSEALEPFVVEMAAVLSMQDEWTAVVA